MPVNAYDGRHEVGMMFRALRKDPHGEALESDGRPVAEGASMMTRLLTPQAGAGRRQLLPGEEEPYAFVDRLAAGEDPRLAGLPWPGQRPAADEIAIGDGWRIQVAAPRSPAVVTAVDDLAGPAPPPDAAADRSRLGSARPRPDRARSRSAKGRTWPTDRGRRPAIVLSRKASRFASTAAMRGACCGASGTWRT